MAKTVRVSWVGGPLCGLAEADATPLGLPAFWYGPDPVVPKTHCVVYELHSTPTGLQYRFNQALTNKANEKANREIRLAKERKETD